MGTFAAFGVRFASELPLPEIRARPEAAPGSADPAECVIRLVATDGPAARFSGPCDPPAATEAALGDGRTSRIERGRAGDHLLRYGDEAALWVGPGHDVVECGTVDPEAPAWRRYLLDTGLGFVALARGHEALHAGAVSTRRGVLAVAAGSGGGKSTFLAELLRRGLPLFTDDLLMLAPAAGGFATGVVAQPGPPLMNLPPVLADGTPAGRIGRVVAELDDEAWVAVDREPPVPSPVAAVVLLERGSGRDLAVSRVAASPITVLPHSLQGGPGPDRARARFEACSSIAATASVLRVEAPWACPAAPTVDRVLTELGVLGV